MEAKKAKRAKEAKSSFKERLEPGYKRTEVGVIPEDWTIETLGELGKWLSGGTPSMSEKTYWDGSVPWVSPKDMKVARLHDASDHVSEKALTNGTRLAPQHALLIVVRGMILAHSLPVARAERSLAFNQDIKALIARDSVDSNFLLWWFQANRSALLSLTAESTHGTKRLPSETLFAQKIALPPLPEQKAIAEVLNKADALIECFERLVAKKHLLKRGVMQKLLRPKDKWVTIKLGSLGVFLKGSGVRKDESMSGDLPCVRYGEIYTKHNDYIKRFHSWISREVAATAKRLKAGDLLFAGSGETKEEIGKCVAFVDDLEAYAGGDIVILRQEKTNSVFMGYYLNTGPINRQKASKGQGDAVVHISASALADIDITIPALNEQVAIAAIFSAMDAEIVLLEAQLAKYRQIKQGLMQNLLTGRIRLV